MIWCSRYFRTSFERGEFGSGRGSWRNREPRYARPPRLLASRVAALPRGLRWSAHGAPLARRCLQPRLGGDDSQFIREAKFYEKLPYKKTKCKLCPRECVIDDQERGYCGVRENRGGTYYTLVHSRVVTAHIDPIEKKPFFHFLPGAVAFSLATAGAT